jgi:sulfopyruvate decarboxylase TPP-binding subunit
MKIELAKRTVAGLKQAGINFVSYIPETRLSEILPVMKADDFFVLAPVASEAEAVGIAAGAALVENAPLFIWRERVSSYRPTTC